MCYLAQAQEFLTDTAHRNVGWGVPVLISVCAPPWSRMDTRCLSQVEILYETCLFLRTVANLTRFMVFREMGLVLEDP